MLEDIFRGLCEEAADKKENYGSEFSADGKLAVFAVYRRMIKLELVFKRRSWGEVNNVLYCRVYPNKINGLFYLLPEVFVELDIPEYRSVFFSMIENEARLRACFAQLMSIIEEHLPAIEAAADEGRLPWAYEATDDDYPELRMVFSDSADFREPFVILDYTKGNVYRAILNGNYKKAVEVIERYRRKGRTLEYQNRLCDHIKENGAGFSPMPEECNAVRDDDAAEKKAFPFYAGVYLTSFLTLSAVFFAAKLVFDLFFSRGTVAVYGAPWYFCFVLGALPSLFGAVLFRKQLVKLLFPKRAKRMTERDEVRNGKGVDRIAGAAFAAAAGFAIFAFIMTALPAVRVFPDRLDYPSEDDLFRREEYLFSEIGEICHISSRWNSMGERIGRPSYVIIMKDGRRLDLDASLSDRQAEEELLPLLKDYSIPITELDSDRELENRGGVGTSGGDR